MTRIIVCKPAVFACMLLLLLFGPAERARPEPVQRARAKPAGRARDANIKTPPQPTEPRPAQGNANDPLIPAAQVVTSNTPLKVGMPLEAHWISSWWPATVSQLLRDGRVKVHYDGWPASMDEVLPRTQLRLTTVSSADTPALAGSRSPTLDKLTAGGAAGAAGDETVGNVSAATVLKPGQRLQTKWYTGWLDSQVVELLPNGRVKIHYIGWSADFDDVVPRERLRLPTATK